MPYLVKKQLVADWKTRRGKFNEEYPLTTDVQELSSVDGAWDALNEIYTSINPQVEKRTFHASWDETMQKKLWLARHDLFYAILIELSEHSMVTLPSGVTTIPDIMLYKIENFGSAKSTSDIDACIQYDGPGDNHVSWVIQAIEDRYVELGCPCLDLDIEFYDSYISRGDPHHPDKAQTYTVTGVQDKEAAFLAMLPYALASMMRNVYLGDPLEGTIMRNTKNHLERRLGVVFSSSKRDELDEIIRLPHKSSQNLPTILNVFIEEDDEDKEEDGSPTVETTFNSIAKECQRVLQCVLTQLIVIPDVENLLNDAKTKCIAYFQSTTYDDQRRAYYGCLDTAADKLKTETNNVDKLTAFSHSQLYRQEGYICVTTVMHVPRVMQQCKENAKTDRCLKTDSTDLTGIDACPTNTMTHPSCILGDYDYILSIIEQLGFILRFYVESKKKFDEHCQKKYQKYMERVEDAYRKLSRAKQSWVDINLLRIPDPATVRGGKRTKTRRTRRKRKGVRRTRRKRKGVRRTRRFKTHDATKRAHHTV